MLVRKIVVSSIVLGVLAGPVFAQQKRPDDPLVIMEKEKKDRAEAVDQQYKKTLDQTRRQPDATRSDPWANMRGPSDSKR
jgi:hypothetical protein